MEKAAYITVYEQLKGDITCGKYPVGSLLPTEPELEVIFGVSRTTVRRSVEMLSREGFVSARQGVGTVVLDFSETKNLSTITSFTDNLRRSGHVVTLRSTEIAAVPASQEIAKALGLTQGTPVARIMRTTYSDGVPIAIIKNYIDYSLVEGIEKFTGDLLSLYELLGKRYFITFDMARDRVSALPADAERAEALRVPEGFPLLCIRRLCFARNKPVCFDRLYIRSDMYEFEVSLYGVEQPLQP